MELSDEAIKEIASELELGLICFYNRKTGEVESHPDLDHPDVESELWQDVVDKIEADWDNYVRIDPMRSNEAFKIMGGFALTVEDEDFQNRIYRALSRRGPFRNFNELIHESAYRQDWFDYKTQYYQDWVRRQVEFE